MHATSVRSARPAPPGSPRRRSRRHPGPPVHHRDGPRTRFAPCALADMGRCVAPCDGRIDPERYGELVRRLVSSLTSPGGLLGALERRMAHLAEPGTLRGGGLGARPAARAGRRAWRGAGPTRGSSVRERSRSATPDGSSDRFRWTERWCGMARPMRSASRARGSGPTSSRPCAPGSARTTRGWSRAAARSPSRSTVERDRSYPRAG